MYLHGVWMNRLIGMMGYSCAAPAKPRRTSCVHRSNTRLLDLSRTQHRRWALFTPNGAWEIENHAVTPEIEVKIHPASWRAGHDLQLEPAVQVVMDELQRSPPKKAQQPKPPVYQRKTPPAIP